MDLVLIYGAPAVGKLTVARELSRITSFGVFHNHLSFDIASAFFTPFTEPFGDVLHRIRMETFRACCDNGAAGCIFTLCYDHPSDAPEVEEIAAVITQSGGSLLPVLLICGEDELMKRVADPGRKEFRKLSSPEKLKITLKKWNLTIPVQGYDSLQIDNTTMPAEEAAAKIAEHYRLPAAEH